MQSALAATLGLAVLFTTSALSQRAVPRPGAPAAGRAVPRVETAVPFKVGEALTFDVSWSQIVAAGTATATIKEKKPSFGSTAYYVVVEGRPVPLVAKLYPLYYKMDSLIDAYGLLSQRGSLYSEERGGRRMASTRFDRPGNKASFEITTETTSAADLPVPALTQDGLAAIYAVRGRGFKTGEHFAIPVADSGIIYSAQVDVGAVETVKVPFGQSSAWNLKVAITDPSGEHTWKNAEMWISTDARRLPMKMQAELPFGHFVLVLSGVR